MELKQNKLEHINSSLMITKGKELPAGEFEAILSTDDLDRHGEVVSIKGMQIPTDQVFKIYYNHETTGANLPIGQWTKIWKSIDGKLKGRGKIDLLDDFEIKIDKKIKLGTLDSISIGFYPQEFDGESSTWTKSTLVEASVVAEPANTKARVTQKDLGFTEDEFNESLKVKLAEVKDEPLVSVKRYVKGAVEDVLTEPKKWELMRPYYDVMYAFEEAFYDEDIPATDFNKLLSETISLLQKIVDGSYDLTDKSSGEDGATASELKTAVDVMNSRLGAVEQTLKEATEHPAKKNLIKVRLAVKQVGQAADKANRIIKVKLQETSNV